MRSQLIVCTCNRPREVERLLRSYAGQAVRPPALFVDSSDDEQTAGLVRDAARHIPGLSCIRAPRGLTRQRMAGIAAVPRDVEVVHFVDDDVVLDRRYFESIERAFFDHPGVVGVGGLIENNLRRNAWWWRRSFLLDSPAGGLVLRSGVNTPVLAADTDVQVQWLPGCSMSYRRWLFDMIAFDVRMKGYCLGEDVEFSYRAGFAGELWITPGARLRHLQSPVGRETPLRLARVDAVHRHRRVAELRGHGLSLPAFWRSLFGAIMLSLFQGFFRLSRYSFRRAAALMGAAVDIWAGGPLAPCPRLPGRHP